MANPLIVVLIWVACLIGLFYFIIKVLRLNRIPNSIAFFHPNCNAGGGGEYVLWAAVRAVVDKHPDKEIYIYTSGPASKADASRAVNRAIDVFGLVPTPGLNNISLVHLTTGKLMFRDYRHFTLLFQSLGCFIAGIEAFWRLLPEFYIDTTGAAFTYPVFKYLGKCFGVAGYTHYPTIHSDMIRDVRAGDITSVCVSEEDKNTLRKRAKIAYYKIMTKLYSGAGSCADIIMANGTWTSNHIRTLWKPRLGINIVYPPCKITNNDQERMRDGNTTTIISIGQFRPEKRHKDQVAAFHTMLLRHPDLFGSVKLVFVGSTRGPADEALRESVRNDCATRGLLATQAVEFPENVNSAQKDLLLSRSVIGLHMMHDEHFGICVVEYMAAGVVPVAHKSAGPELDIVVPALTASDCIEGADRISREEDVAGGSTVGMLASTMEEFAECLYTLVSNERLRNAMSVRARERAKKFSIEEFNNNFMDTVSGMFDQERNNEVQN